MSELGDILDRQVNDFRFMYDGLWSDVEETVEATKKSNALSCSRRCAARACFAFIEGVSFRSEALAHLIRVIRKDKVSGKHVKTMARSIILTDKRQRKIAEHDKRPLSQRVKESFKALSALSGNKTDLSTQNREWASFKEAIEIRNRIAHPKSGEDLVIKDKEFTTVLNATAWYHNMFSESILGPENLKKAV